MIIISDNTLEGEECDATKKEGQETIERVTGVDKMENEGRVIQRQ